MAAFSPLRSKAAQDRLAHISKIYATNRPLIQRILNISFVLYVLGTTYYGLSGGGRKGKGKAVEGKPDRKPERVAVRLSSIISFFRLSDDRRGPIHHQVNAVFYQRLSRILRIVIPGIRSKEALLLIMHSSLLVFRTAISLYVAALDGKYVIDWFSRNQGAKLISMPGSSQASSGLNLRSFSSTSYDGS
jgi:ATP-binding cassette subfamily D (ALD) long-chain fatty acid import protein